MWFAQSKKNGIDIRYIISFADDNLLLADSEEFLIYLERITVKQKYNKTKCMIISKMNCQMTSKIKIGKVTEEINEFCYQAQ